MVIIEIQNWKKSVGVFSEEKWPLPGMVQLEVNSNSLLSTLRPRSLAIVRRRKTQASNMTAVTVAETRLRLLRGSHPGLLPWKPLFPPLWPPWPLRSEVEVSEMKKEIYWLHGIQKTKPGPWFVRFSFVHNYKAASKHLVHAILPSMAEEVLYLGQNQVHCMKS